MLMPYAPSWGIKLVRRIRRLSREDFAAATRMPLELVAEYEEERQPLPGETLLAVIAALGLTHEERQALIRLIPHIEPPEWNSAQYEALVDRSRQAIVEQIFCFRYWRTLKGGDPWEIEADVEREKLRAIGFGQELYIVEEMILQEGARRRAQRPSGEDRKQGSELWERMKFRDTKTRKAFLEAAEFRHWALCERMGYESLKLARRWPKQVVELAELAVLLARRIRGKQAWRRRLRGFALACLGNACLTQGDRPRAEEILVQARRFWEAGAAKGTEILAEAPLQTLAAALEGEEPAE